MKTPLHAGSRMANGMIVVCWVRIQPCLERVIWGLLAQFLVEVDEKNPREKQKMSDFRDTGKPRWWLPTPFTAGTVSLGQWQGEKGTQRSWSEPSRQSSFYLWFMAVPSWNSRLAKPLKDNNKPIECFLQERCTDAFHRSLSHTHKITEAVCHLLCFYVDLWPKKKVRLLEYCKYWL